LVSGSYQPSRRLVLAVLNDSKPKTCREVAKATGLSECAAYSGLFNCWKSGIVLRTREPIYEHERIFKGRGGITQTTRPYHLRAFNRKLSKERVVVEHTISQLKKFRVMAHEFRNRLKHYDIMTTIVCGLTNFSIMGTMAI